MKKSEKDTIRHFLIALNLCFKVRLKCETIDLKVTREVLHIASSGKWGVLALEGGRGTPYNGLYGEVGMGYLFLASGT